MHFVQPEQAGFSSQRLKRLDGLLRNYVDSGLMPHAQMLVARQGQVVYFESFGMRNHERRLPVERDTIFRIYSMTKPVVSVAVMMLLERGCFALHDPVAEYIPQFKNMKVYVDEGTRADLESPMTIQHLLTHTAGLLYTDRNGPVEAMYIQAGIAHQIQSLEQLVERLGQIPLVFHPGTAWRYSIAVDVLGYLVQVVSGRPLETFLHEAIFEPLRMVDTAFYVPPDKFERFAEMYAVGHRAIGRDQAHDYRQRPAWTSGGGGLVSTTSDYLRFCQMLANGGTLDNTRILGRKTVDLMTMNHVSPEFFPLHFGGPMYGYGFGLGFGILLDVPLSGRLASAGEYGWSGGIGGTHFWIDPVEDMIAIFMTQVLFRDKEGNPVKHRDHRIDLRTLVYQALE